MLSRLAREFADEIKSHDWSDAHDRADRAGHQRSNDTHRTEQLSERQTENVRMNVVWVTGQVLGHADPNFDVVEFAIACGITLYPEGWIKAGVRTINGVWAIPGTFDYVGDTPSLM